MRWIFGLGGLIVTIGVIVWIMSAVELPHDKAAIDAGQDAIKQAQQIKADMAKRQNDLSSPDGK